MIDTPKAAGNDRPLDVDGTAVVVGASLAGFRAAETLRSEGFRGTLTMVGDEEHLPYDRPPLSKQVLAGTWPPEKAMLADRQRIDALRLDLRLGHRATALDAPARRVTLDDGNVIEADGVIVATGSSPRMLPGVELSERVRVLRTLDDATTLHRLVTKDAATARVVVVGAGFIGSEVASTCRTLGCQVDVLEALETPLEPVVGAEVGRACARLHHEGGTRLHVGRAVTAIENVASEQGPPVRVTLDDGMSLAADVVVVGIGVTPNVGWLEGSGLNLDNGVRCDDTLSAAPGIVAAGDLASWPLRGIDRVVRIEHWQVAAEEGVAAARRLLLGPGAPPFVPVPYFWSDQYGVRIQVLGVPGPDHRVEVVDGTLDGGPFVALYGQGDRLTAALAVSRPRQLMAYRPLLQAGASFGEALDLTSA